MSYYLKYISSGQRILNVTDISVMVPVVTKLPKYMPARALFNTVVGLSK